TYPWPSAHVACAPEADSRKSGNGPAHLTIQFMGNPSRRLARASSWRARLLGWRPAKVASSVSSSCRMRAGSTPVGDALAITAASVTAAGSAGQPGNAGQGPAGKGRLVQVLGVAADRARGDATLRVQLEEAGAAIGPAIEPGRHRAPAHAANRGRASTDGRLV